jgi:hypothetical protein
MHMKNIAFAIWAVGFPFVVFNNSDTQPYSDTVLIMKEIIFFAIWGFVGYKLYEK